MPSRVGAARSRTTARSGGSALAAAAALVLAACGAPGDGTGAPTATTAPAAVPTPEVTVTRPSPTTGTPRGSPAEAAVRDLSGRLGVPPEAIRVVRVVEVTWRDQSLGCPQPGMAYAQALADGTLIELEAGGRTYEYHAGERRGPFLCQSPEPPLEVHG